MATPFENLLKCSIGGADFQCVDRTIRGEAMFGLGGARIGEKFEIELEGYIEGSSEADLQTKVSAARETFQHSGQDFTLYSIGGVIERSIPAAICVDAGPHIASYEIKRQKDGAACVREFTVKITGQTAFDDSTLNPNEKSTWKEKIETGADGLRTYTLNGEMIGSGARAKAQADIDSYVATFTGGKWVAAPLSIETNPKDDRGTYSVTVTELVTPLPAGPTVVDGEASMRQSRDEQMRLSNVWDFDLLLKSGGDYMAVITLIRQQLPAGQPILREDFDVTFHQHVRVKATFETLRGGNGNSLMNWTQAFRFTNDDTTYEPRIYPGAEPLLVQRPKAPLILVQSGEAIGAGVFLKPPPPIFPDRLIEQPQTEVAYVNEVEKKSTWSYTMSPPRPTSAGQHFGGVTADHLKRPSPPTFLSGPLL